MPTFPIFRAEDGDSMLLRNVVIYRQVYTEPKPRTTTLSSRPSKPQISHPKAYLKELRIPTFWEEAENEYKV
jgi:hypothetical protein